MTRKSKDNIGNIMMARRIEWIDSARGIGLFLVVFGHALKGNEFTAMVIWSFHMPLFFFLSGLTSSPWTLGASGALMRSLRNLAVPYLFFSSASIILWQLLHGSFTSWSGWFGLLGQMAYGVAGPDHTLSYNVPLWFFPCLLSTRLLFAVITALSTRLRTSVVAVIFMVIFAHTVVFVHFRTLLWNADVALAGLAFYMAGYVISIKVLYTPAAPSRWRGAGVVAATLLAVGIVLLTACANSRVDMNGREFGNDFLFYTGAFAGILATVACAQSISHLAWLRKFGQAAIVIFPLHTLWPEMLPRFMPLMRWYGYRMTHAELGGAIAVSVVEIMLCLPVYYFLKRWAPRCIGLAKSRPAIAVPPATELVT